MVLARKVGKERPFGLVVLLYVVTFGIYGIYWHYKAHAEVYKQFELDREGRDEGIVWLILGLVVFQPLLWVYQYMFVNNVKYVRERLRIGKGISPGAFLGLSIPGGILFAVGLYMAIFGFVLLLVEPGVDEAGGVTTQVEADDANALGAVLASVGGVLFLAGAGLLLGAFGWLQSTLNRVWRAFDARMGQFSAPPAPPAPPGWLPAAAPPVAFQRTAPPVAPRAPPPRTPPAKR